FNGDGLYLMDEPEAALSPLRQLVFLNGLHRVMRAGAQCIVATHSPILMAYPNAQILLFGDGGVERVAYEETEHYVVARRFFADPRMAIDAALKDVE
ncbi:MAG: AAA family ATPase, partial [Candidatus Hydrogenedentes bacterium]|nr:AAA family ATPase [Candidatus Hydrogenedentota bacterium]